MTAPDPRSLTLALDGHTLIAPCIEVTLYFADPPAAHPQDFALRSLAALDSDLTHVITGSMKDLSKRGTKADNVLATTFDRPRPGAFTWMLFRGTAKGVSAAEFKMTYRARTAPPTEGPEFDRLLARHKTAFEVEGAILTPALNIFRATFPLDHPLADPNALLAWVADLETVQAATFVHGKVGLSLNVDTEVGSHPLRNAMTPAVMAALARHPGLGEELTGEPAARLMKYWPGHLEFLPRIKRVQWLTLVPDLALDHFCGGRASVQSALATAPGVVCHPLTGGGLMIQAGPAPALGDVTKGDTLPAYRAVGRALAPARMPQRGAQALGFGRHYDDAAMAYFAALDHADDWPMIECPQPSGS